ncbi:hypothetical protein [Streptacidiphilus anmyonensis]|uniref:hypothetical protein n=1 Tax=Streptacidiphilus anmyonensis TaxID=405782 RepID=UPI00128C99F3|nr:hypothetical protein [Streptacidiphilus anmyonensis]
MSTTRRGTDTEDLDHSRREAVRRRARGMTLAQALRALDGARRDGSGGVETSEWTRISRILLNLPSGARYNPGIDRRVQTELAMVAHRQTADALAARAARAAQAAQAAQTAEAAQAAQDAQTAGATGAREAPKGATADRAGRQVTADAHQAPEEDEVSPGQALEALADAFDAATLVGRLTPWDIDALRALADDRPLTAVLLAAWLRRAYVAGLEQLWETC